MPLYGQILKKEAEDRAVSASTTPSLADLNSGEKERLVKILFEGKDWVEAQKEFHTDSGMVISQDECRRMHDELYAYAEEAKPLVSVGKEIADVEIAKDVALKEAPVEIIKGK